MKGKKDPENRRSASTAALTRENGELRARLAEAEETLRAIRGGEVDAVVVSRPEGDQVFTLQGAERTYRFLVEEMNEGALLLEPGGTILYANARFAAMAGVPLEEVSGGPWERLFAAEARAGLAGLLHQAGSGSARGEFDLVGDSGTKRPVSVSLCSMQRDGVQALCAVLTDLTERKAAEAALKQANEGLERHVAERTAALQQKEGELALILGSTPFMLTRCSRDLRYLYVSRAYAEMLGLPPEEIAGKPIMSVMTEKGFETIRPYVERVLRGERVEYETGVEFSKAGVRELSVTYVPDVDRDRQVVGWVASIRDVTERNRMQEALRESEAGLARAQRTAHLGNWKWDVAKDAVTWSEELFRIFGVESGSFVPSNAAAQAIVHPADRGQHAELLAKALKGEAVRPFECRLVRPDGEERIVLASGFDLDLDAEGRPVRLFGTVLDITERKRAEEALSESERLLREFLEQLPVGAALMDTQGEIRVSNAAYWRMVPGRIPSRDPEGLKRWHAWDTEGKPVEPENWPGARALRGERVVPGMEFLVTEADGQEVWHRVSAVPFVSASAEIVGAISVIENIDAVKRARERLWESEAMLARAQQVANLGSWQWDITRGNLVWSDQIYRTLGLSAQQFRPSYEAFLSVVNPEDRARVSKAVESALAGEPYEVEFRTTRPDGVQRNVLAQGEVDFDASGKPVRMIGTTLDITERKQAEEALRQANERLAYHAQNTPLGVIEFDAELRVRGWSDGAQRIFGWEAAEVMGHRMWEIPWICEEDRGKLEKVAAGLVSGCTLRSVSPNRNLRKDGQVVWCEWYNSSLTDASGKMQSIQSLVLDVTKRKEAEAVLARDKEQLQRLVKERTAKLQELVGELEHFSYTITHDLKSPLRAMRGFAEIMRVTCCECDQGQAKEFLGRISTSAERMDHLIADALNYSRSVRQELPLEDVDAGVLLRGMLDSYPEFQPAKATICVEGTLPVVLANEAGLTQCFSNLLGNAVKFVEAGKKPDIRVWASHRGDWVRIWVEDKGIGISRDMLPRVFDMFSRGSKAYEGTGIGLALVRKVAQRMGGKVGVESEEGKGSRFWIELSCRAAEPVLAAAVARQAGNGDEGTVLYVEDEESDAMFMEQAFKKKGGAAKLRVVGDGRAAIQYLSGAGDYGDRVKYPVPALVLLDIGLPQVTGFGVLEWIRNNPDYRQLPVVMFSSSTRDDDRTKAKELGADEFVAKPSSGLAFGEVVEGLQGKWLGRRSRS